MVRSCPKGQILRKSYTRKSYRRSSGKRVKGSRVPAKCIRDLGSKGKGRKVIIDLQKGALTNLGYKVANNASSRRSSLKKAVDKYGSSSVIHKLNVLNSYNKRKSPAIAKKVKDDMKFVRKLK